MFGRSISFKQDAAVEDRNDYKVRFEIMTVQVILDGLGNMLKMASPNHDIIANAIEEAGGLDKLEKLQQHKNEDIYKLAYAIIDKFFSSDDFEDATLNPASGAQAFQFGPTSNCPDGGFQF